MYMNGKILLRLVISHNSLGIGYFEHIRDSTLYGLAHNNQDHMSYDPAHNIT